ncbi:MAG: hydrolase [Rhodocyclaceae bacterium]|nr:hydrolase [Rhodocyclaceae bacterium]
MQTMWALLCKGRMPAYRRERWDTPDGDFIDVDWATRQAGTPLVVLFHGLEGSSRSHYARALMRAVAAAGWSGAVVHFRGCSGTPNRLARAYHSGDAAEIDWILQRFRSLWPDAPRFAAGVSLGGNALLCWLGAQGAQAGAVISAAAAVCAPLDLALCGRALERGFARVYTRHFLRSLKPRALAKLQRWPGSVNAAAVHKARTLYEFDDAVTAPLHGYHGAQDYWTRASAKHVLGQIALPTLILHARNDPFVPLRSLPAPEQLPANVTLEVTAEGGHVGFVSSPFPGRLDWMPQRLLEFFAQPEISRAKN